jgi:hypothetical protein
MSLHVRKTSSCPNCGASSAPSDARCGYCGSFFIDSYNRPKQPHPIMTTGCYSRAYPVFTGEIFCCSGIAHPYV